ncbi:uncharacterized protein LOC126687629 [Mercurialis annua]|uniref:uncharacterized protein LOC126687629 n=1 Tax=Mercurialis annua TaxID=3986 RepID=UPI00215F6DA0|nr:uncharacterized protein LOC126687629 [Mercurialis annua]
MKIQMRISRTSWSEELDHALPRVGINRWSDLAKEFLNKYFPMAKTAKLTRDIMLYKQLDGESVSDAWERYQEMQRKVPHHHITRETLIQNFYNGSDDQTRSIIDTAAGGSLMRKTTNAAFELLDELAVNSCSWPTERAKAPAQRGAMAININPVAETVKSLLQDFLTKQVVATNTHSVAAIQNSCEVCGDLKHVASECYVMSQPFNEQVNFVGGQRPFNDHYSNTYNQGWRNHSNFSWKDNGSNTHNQAGPSKENKDHSKIRETSRIKAAFTIRTIGHNIHLKDAETQQALKNHAATIHNQELQIQQMAKALQNRNQGGLPSTSEANPREQVKAITLRSSKVLPKDHAEKVLLEAEKE